MTIEGARAFHLSRYGEIDERQIELTCIRNGIAHYLKPIVGSKRMPWS